MIHPITRSASRSARIQVLRSIPLFRSCSHRQLNVIDSLVDQLAVDAGEVLTQEGRRELRSFVIVNGHAEVTRSGRRLATLGPGDFFGEMAILDGQARTATVTAVTPVHLLEFGPSSIPTLAAIPPVGRFLLRGMASRLRAADQVLAEAELATS
jgi:CRP-like cAMP-binding protein